MKAPYPVNFEVEINRPLVAEHFFREANFIISCFAIFVGLGIYFSAFLDKAVERFENPLLLTFAFPAIFALIFKYLAPLLVSPWTRRVCQARADFLSLKVEGNFLVVSSRYFGETTKRIHFKAVISFAVYEDKKLRKRGINELRIETSHGNPQSAIITVPGVENCHKMCKALSEIDAQRE